MSGIVIIGAGQAGSSLAIKLRTLGYEGAVTLIGEEPYAPYQRPPLSKTYLLGEMALERLYLRPQELYRDHNIELRLAAQVTAIDPVAGVVSLGP
jgi:3-phenylpropionate/trans-cinnamate dioxygenase ferredoxin reductase subunit